MNGVPWAAAAGLPAPSDPSSLPGPGPPERSGQGGTVRQQEERDGVHFLKLQCPGILGVCSISCSQ